MITTTAEVVVLSGCLAALIVKRQRVEHRSRSARCASAPEGFTIVGHMTADRWITDDAVSERYPLYTRANAGEVLPEPVSPLTETTTTWQATNARVARRPDQRRYLRATRGRAERDHLAVFGGYLYINVSLARMFGVRGPDMTAEMIDFTYFGDHPDVPPYVRRPGTTARRTPPRWACGCRRCSPATSTCYARIRPRRTGSRRAPRPHPAHRSRTGGTQRAGCCRPCAALRTAPHGHRRRLDRARDPRRRRRGDGRSDDRAHADHRRGRRRLGAAEP